MIFPNAFTEIVSENYRRFRKSNRCRQQIYACNEVLFIKGLPGSGKTAGALNYCRLYPSTLYFSFANLDTVLAPRIFSERYPAVFQACRTWEAFFDRLYDYGIKKHCIIFFDDAAMRSDKDEFIEGLQRILRKNTKHDFLVIFLMKPWEDLPLTANIQVLEPMPPAVLRRTMGLKDEDTFRLYTLTDGNPYLLDQYDRERSFEDNVRSWLAYGSRFRSIVPKWMADCFRSPESYNTLMYGMAVGLNRVSEMSDLSGFPMNKVDKYLKALLEHDLILREKESGSRTRYGLSKNYLTLWYRFLMTSGMTSDGNATEETVSAFMDYLDNVLVPETFRRTVLQWLDGNYKHYTNAEIDVHKPYLQNAIENGIKFDYVYKPDERGNQYIVVKLFDHLEDRCGKEDWCAIDDAMSSMVPHYESTLILASIHRFSDYCWQNTAFRKNAKLIQIQTLNRVGFEKDAKR